MIAFEDLDPTRIERAVQMLLRRLYPVTSIDGSGGDDAQDLRWDSDDGLVIFEVKKFAKRLASSHKRQIKKSLQKATRLHAPARWVLVLPLNRTPAEDKWFNSLAAEFPGVHLEWWGRDWLDEQFAQHEDLVAAVEGPDYKLLRRAQQVQQEQAILAGGAVDLVNRVRRLGERVADISPHWYWDTFTRGPDVTLVLREKYPGAARVDPIDVRPQFDFPQADPEAQSIARHLRDAFSVGGEVAVPGRFIKSLDITAASEETRRLLGPPPSEDDVEEFRFVSVPDRTGLPVSVHVELLDPSGSPKAEMPVALSERLAGSDGFSLRGADPTGTVRVRVALLEKPEDGGVAGKFELNPEPLAGRLPHDVLPALEFVEAVAPGDTLTLRVGPVSLGRTLPLAAEDVKPLTNPAQYVRALVRLQEHAKTLLPIPADPDPVEVRTTIDAAALLEGKRVQINAHGLNLTLKRGQASKFLQDVSEDGALYATHDTLITVGDREVRLGQTAMSAPAVRLANRADLWARAHEDIELSARFECVHGERIYWLLPVDQEQV